jgi:1,4-alpha-glucan branching enzyme
MTVQMPSTSEPIAKGANLIAGGNGAIFSCWAPGAKKVWISGSFNGWSQTDQSLLNRVGADWVGLVAQARQNDTYKFYVEGEGTSGYKRDPHARELSHQPAYPLSDCILRHPGSYPWHDVGYRPPKFNDLVLYQLHVGVFYGPDRLRRPAKFLDVLKKLDYLVALGIMRCNLCPSSNMRIFGASDMKEPISSLRKWITASQMTKNFSAISILSIVCLRASNSRRSHSPI